MDFGYQIQNGLAFTFRPYKRLDLNDPQATPHLGIIQMSIAGCRHSKGSIEIDLDLPTWPFKKLPKAALVGVHDSANIDWGDPCCSAQHKSASKLWQQILISWRRPVLSIVWPYKAGVRLLVQVPRHFALQHSRVVIPARDPDQVLPPFSVFEAAPTCPLFQDVWPFNGSKTS